MYNDDELQNAYQAGKVLAMEEAIKLLKATHERFVELKKPDSAALFLKTLHIVFSEVLRQLQTNG